MNIYISYFYQIRNFTKYQIPVSTAMWEPTWYLPVHYDKNNVINGAHYKPFILPEEKWNELCKSGLECRKECPFQHGECEFEKVYYNHLTTLDYEKVLLDLNSIRRQVAVAMGLEEDLEKFEIVLMVHEAPWRTCAERPCLIHYFKDHGYDLKEWSKP